VRAYSQDLRTRVLLDLDAGVSADDCAAKYRVSASWVRRLRQRRRETGETTPRPSGKRPRLLEGKDQAIRDAVAARPDDTLAELKARLALAVSLATLWRAVARLGLTLKKR